MSTSGEQMDGGRTTADRMWKELVERLQFALDIEMHEGGLVAPREQAEFLAKLVREWIERNSQLMILVGRYEDPALGGKE